MAPADDPDGLKTEELSEVIRGIRERVRARYPDTSLAPFDIALPDLMPMAHARDAAEAKVAAIGTVNPRSGGLLNTAVQWVKRMVARSLDWHVREQVEFNRNAMACVEACIEALNANNRALLAMSARIGDLRAQTERSSGEMADLRAHWPQWRAGWEQKLAVNEVQFLRSVADLQGAFQHRVTLMEGNFRDVVKSQHADFMGALEHHGARFWLEMEKVRLEYEKVIHEELRIVRQRAAWLPPGEAAAVPAEHTAARPAFDYGRFAERFRGSEEYVREKQKFYVPYFKGRTQVVDLGCGRGEFLEAMREAGVPGRGIDVSAECVARCREKGLEAVQADLISHLDGLPEGSLDGIFSAQVVEHLPPDRLPELVRLAALKLKPGGLLAIETPNPECLAIFATHFFLDPTHQRPVPHPLLAFYMEEAGFGRIDVQRLSPAVETMPSLAALPNDFLAAFFGGLDYAILGRRL
ncbi:MAG: class I SAM-dependent methyltransferase [Bryobacteraceae bacterium]